MNKMQEQWKTIEGFEGYLISSKGRVKSFKRGKEKVLKGSNHKDGYRQFQVNKRTYGGHQLVAMAFLNHNPKDTNLVIDHIDENKQNNELSNLRIVTTRFNVGRSFKNSTSKYTGVSFENGKYRARIKIKDYKKHLGSFTCEICAHLAYLNAVKEVEGIQ